MNHRPILLGIVGDSGAGKTTLTSGIAQILGQENITVIGTDDYHRYDRLQRTEIGITALHPDCNYLDIMQQHLTLLRSGQPILKPIYNHNTGTFDPPQYIKPNKFIIVEGLLGYSTPALRECYDVKVYLAPQESIRYGWKIKRDILNRGYTEAQVLTELEKREADSAQFIQPQRQWADLAIVFYPPSHEAEVSSGHLNVKLILRPTISHPDLSKIVASQSSDEPPTIRLTLDRDMGKPVDVLEVDAQANRDAVKVLGRMICNDLPELHSFCDREIDPNLGKITDTTGAILQSYPLALTQLLITYHMLKATQNYH